MDRSEVVSRIFEVFHTRGHRSYGEHVTELEHALQCATFAEEAGDRPEIVAASLLHDIGHLLHDLGEDIAARGVDTRHERVGANLLSQWFGPEIVEPVRMHADSKRYLCAIEDGYFTGLSEASRRSLALQGGPMTLEEARKFESHDHFRAAIQVRRWDDRGKIPDMPTLPLESFRPLLESLVHVSP